MKRLVLLFLALLLLAGCGYSSRDAVHVVDPDRLPPAAATAPSDDPPSAEYAILTALEDSLRDNPDLGLRIVSLEVAADRVDIRVSAPNGLALSLAHGGDDTVGTWSNACGAMTVFARKAADICAANGREDVTVCAFLLNDANPDRVLYALRGSSVVYNVKSAPVVGDHVEASAYILNTSTKRIHNTWCPSISSIAPEHLRATSSSLSQLLGEGYTKCGQAGDWDKVPSTAPAADTVGTPLDELGGGVAE